MQVVIHQTHHTIADFESISETLKNTLSASTEEKLHLFPELFLTGYPLQDLCLQKPFIHRYQKMLNELNKWLQEQPKQKNKTALVGGLYYDWSDHESIPEKIENVIWECCPGHPLKKIYVKRLLPNYDIFDEQKYFSPGNSVGTYEIGNQKFGLLLCEDMWHSNVHVVDPVKEMKEQLKGLDGIINLSASPFHLGKHEKRIKRAKEISKYLGAPFFYVNRVGGEDEILFDGSSFIVAGNEKVAQGKIFHSDEIKIECKNYNLEPETINASDENSWESLFAPQINKENNPPTLNPLNDEQCKTILEALNLGIQEYASKCGFNKFLVAQSGGIDSSLVLTMMKFFLKEGQALEAIYMPGHFSANISYDLSEQLCKNLDVPLKNFPIKSLHNAVRDGFRENFSEEMVGLTDENIQSRMRGALLYGRSNQTGAMVLNTSNKSELAVGYSTLYGDSVGAISLLGDLYKSEVFTLASYINKRYENVIPEGVITRPPSAELREGQMDEQSLPPYARLDAILEGILSYRLGIEELIELGFSQEEVIKTYDLYQLSEYKRKQFGPIIKLRPKSFGFGYRVPICKKMR